MGLYLETQQAGLDWKAAQTATEQVIRTHSKTFYFATGLLPQKERDAVRALYAFCRTTDDLVDRNDASIEDIEAWRRQVDLPAGEQSDPILVCWAQVRRQYQIDRRYEKELIDGVGMDLNFRSYKTWADLKRYCYHVASTVGLLSIPIIGLAPRVTLERAAPYAIKLGIALQLTNILRDVGEDARRGRVYLPEEDLLRFGLTVRDIHQKVYDLRFINLMKFEIQRAREIYRQALPGIAMLNRAVRPAVGAAALLYRAILDEIESIRYQVHLKRAYTTAWRKLRMLPSILYTILTLPKPKESY